MGDGVTFNGKHSYQDMHLLMRTISRPIMPEPKIITDEAPGMDGDYDYSESNPDKRTKYQSVNHELEFTLIERDIRTVRSRARQIALWLMCGEQQLIYDNSTIYFYLARVINKLDLERLIISARRFTVQFKCRPFPFSVFKSSEQLQRGIGLMRGYGLIRGMTPLTFAVTGSMTVDVYNPGWYVKPVLKVAGTYDSITFSCNGKSLTYDNDNGTVDIDCQKMRAIEGSVNRTNYLSDDYEPIEFVPGDNALEISGSGLNCTVTIEFRYLF